MTDTSNKRLFMRSFIKDLGLSKEFNKYQQFRKENLKIKKIQLGLKKKKK